MIKISHAVARIVAASDFATEGLQNGCLNLSAYAERIKDEVERTTKKPVHKSSIVVALARLSDTYHTGNNEKTNFELYNLVSRTDLAELSYSKTPALQKSFAALFERPDVQTAPFCVSTIGITEISVVTQSALAAVIRSELYEYRPVLYIPRLASLTMQVAIETVDTPGQSCAVLKQLALRGITIVEYVTTPAELTIILYERDLKQAFVILHDRFFAS